MTCKNCGEQLPENVTLCPKCGTDNNETAEISAVEGERTVPRGFSSKKNIIIIIVIAVLLIIGSVTAIAVTNYNSVSSRAERGIELAERYLNEQNYEQAIIEFQKVLEIEPMNVDAYLGLADVYEEMGDIDKAAEILQDGLEKTGDERIQQRLDELLKLEESFAIKPAVSEMTETTQAESTTTTISTTTMDKTSESELSAEETYHEIAVEFVDENASYTIDVISDREAHIEITSELISDEYIMVSENHIISMPYILNLDNNINVFNCSLNIDNVEIGVFDWNFEGKKDYSMRYSIDPQIFESSTDIRSLYDVSYNLPYSVDTKNHKILFDVTIPDDLPDDFDFSFNNYENIWAYVSCYKFDN